jgi:5-methylcytosine-specific restriction endonuclease McrA
METKVCTKCLALKEINCFGKHARNKDGMRYECKECNNKSTAEYRLKNADKLKQWRLDNLEKESERIRKYYANHPEKRRQLGKKYREANVEKIKQYKKLYNKSNPEKSNDYRNVRRARKKLNGVFKLTNKELKKLYNSPCFYCGSHDSIQIDHVIPIAKGGTHGIGNLVSACQKCNKSKSDKLIIEWKTA